MLISFSVSNWRLFRDEVNFSMLATSEKQNKETVAEVSLIGAKVLPVAAIYGGNASGKTSLVKAVAFVQDFIVRGTLPGAPITVDPFALDKNFLEKPSCFKMQILVQDKCYEFSFSVDGQKIHEERLVQILKKTEKELYSRNEQIFHFNTTLARDKRLAFIAEGTRPNQLFLTNSVSQNIEQHSIFKSIYDWFKENLSIVMPESQFGSFERFMQETDPLSEKINQILPLLDMGITGLKFVEVDINSLGFSPVILQNLKSLDEKQYAKFKNVFGDMVVVRNNKEGLIAEKLMTKHIMADGEVVNFNMRDESDGSKRCIDLLPIFIDLISGSASKTYLVDEIDRSLHTELFIQLLEFYLGYCESSKRSQLIFTTHNLLTMDQNLLRRDEMWATERNSKNYASLISFGDYKDIRKDKDIRKSYRQGRLGGIPKIKLDSAMISQDDPNEQKT